MKTICHSMFLCLFIALISSSCGYFNGNVAGGYASRASSDYIEVQNVKYRKAGSHRAFLGAIGVVRGVKNNVFELRDSSPKELDGLEVHQIASLNTSAAVNAKFSNNENLTLAFNKTLNKKGSFEIFQILNTGELINTLNKEKNKKLLKLLSKSSDYRIVTSILILSNNKKFRQISSNPNIYLKLSNKNGKPMLQTGVKGRKKFRNRAKLVFSDGMIIGYEYSVFCWNKSEDGWKVAGLSTDQPGLAAHCPAGSTSYIESASAPK